MSGIGWWLTRARTGLAGRLFTAQILVVLTATVTAVVAAAVLGPVIFHDHLHKAAGITGEATRHVEEAFTSASAISLGVALVTALVAAAAVSAFVARRVAQPVTQLARVAAEVADGHYEARAAAPRIGVEFDTVVSVFNAMAARLAQVEATRRRLLADLGHELRTPIGTIEAYLEAVQDGISVEDEDTLSVLLTQTARLRRLADDLVAVSRAEEHQIELHPARTAPAELVAGAVAAARPRYEAKGVELGQRSGPNVPDFEVDPERLGQVLANLLDNALRYTPAGGRVSLSVYRDPAGVRIEVRDTGEGITAEHLPHIFERLYRADTARDRDHGGSGIGLAIARALVTEHGGKITADSAGPGKGATFTVILPAVSGQ